MLICVLYQLFCSLSRQQGSFLFHWHWVSFIAVFCSMYQDMQEKELVPKWQFVCAQIVWSHQIRFSIVPTNNSVFHVYRNVLQEPLFQWCALHGRGYMEMKGGPLPLLLPRKSEQHSYPSLCWSFWKIDWRELWMRMGFCYMGRHLMLAKGGLLSILP